MKLEITAQMETGRTLLEEEIDQIVQEIQDFLDDDSSLFNVFVELTDVQDGEEPNRGFEVVGEEEV